MAASSIYRPSQKIALASSFEGIVNNGATECALTSFNAYRNMAGLGREFFGETVEPADFQKIRDHRYVREFLALRPVVETAEDYFTVLELIRQNPEKMDRVLRRPDDEESYRALLDGFEQLKADAGHAEQRRLFGEKKTGAFYTERARMKAADLNEWLNTQEPYADAIDQFRQLVATQVRDEGAADAYAAVERGFVPWFATSKDEPTTYLLCKIYSQTDKMNPVDVAEDGRRVCVISRDRLVGMETVPSRDKVEQLSLIAEREGVPREMTWRLNDRYDPAQQEELRDNGFVNQFVVPGYMFPHDVRKAMEDPLVRVLDRGDFAAQLGEFAREKGF